MAEVTLTWEEHHNTLCGMFEKLLDEGALVDCTLAAEGKYVNVHKTILSAVSPYFELIFTQESENNPIVILTDIKFQELKAMIDFIYRGKVNVPEEFLDDFVCAAESLQIKGLGRDYMKNQKQNGTAMTYAKEFPNHVSCIPLNQQLVNVVSGKDNSGTATLSSLEAVDVDMDFDGHTAISFQTNPLKSCQINLSSTSANVVDGSISSRLSHKESELNSISPSNSLCLETCERKHEPKSEEEEVVNMEFVECREECVEEDASHCLAPSETTCRRTSSSTLVTAGECGLQMDPLGYDAPNQNTSSVGEFEKCDQDLLGPVSSLQPISFPQPIDFLSVSTLPSTSGIDKGLEINTEDVKHRIEFSESCKEFASEESAFESEIYTSEATGAEEGEVEVVEVEEDDEEVVEAEGAPSLAGVECRKVLGDASQPSVHARTHAGDRPNACHLCGKDLKYPSLLTRHLRTHTGERPYACEVCGKAFSKTEHLTRHLRTHTGERPFVCEMCGKDFLTKTNLTKHLRTHTGERPFACLTCGKAFGDAFKLSVHARIHTGERPFVCEVCGKAFQKKVHLTVHLRTHAGERPFVCDMCGKYFQRKEHLTRHLRTHTRERPYACLTCGKAFGDAFQLRVHARIHTGERPFVCDVCQRAFQTKSHLTVHLRMHAGERPFACGMCGKDFQTKAVLKRHLRTHTGERPYACPTCAKAFALASTLKDHVRTHTGERPFACEVCGKAFQTKSNLTVHLRVHTGERPFVCGMCGKDFHTKTDLKVHLRTHTGERPLVCPTCQKAFTRGTHLKNHLRIHTGELPFVCEACGKAFRETTALTKHRSTHIQVTPTTPVSSDNSSQHGAR